MGMGSKGRTDLEQRAPLPAAMKVDASTVAIFGHDGFLEQGRHLARWSSSAPGSAWAGYSGLFDPELAGPFYDFGIAEKSDSTIRSIRFDNQDLG
jgi:hypothetical protein